MSATIPFTGALLLTISPTPAIVRSTPAAIRRSTRIVETR